MLKSPYIVRPCAMNVDTGIHTYLMSDGTQRTMTTDEAVDWNKHVCGPAQSKTQQSFVVKQDGAAVGQLTIFYSGNVCTGGQIHLHQNTPREEKYQVFLKPTGTTQLQKPR